MGFRTWVIVEGVTTGAVVVGAIVAWGALTDAVSAETSARLFLLGIAMVGVAMLLRVAGAPEPPGVVRLWGRDAPEEPDEERIGHFGWIDRLVPLDSPWLLAGFFLIVSSYVVLFIDLRF